MWWDSSITLDLHFLELIPTLDFTALAKYPISSKKLVELTNNAINDGNLSASIGALFLWLTKNKMPNLSGDFEVVHLANIDRFFYIISQNHMKRQMESLLQWYAKLILERWFQDSDKQKLLKFLDDLKEPLNILEKTINSVDSNKQKQLISQGVLQLFHNEMESKKTKNDHKYYEKTFKEHVKYIFLNRKQMFFFNILYEIKFLLLKNIYKTQLYHNALSLTQFISLQLFFLSTIQRLSFSIEHLAFLMRKIVTILKEIPLQKYLQYTDLIRTTVDQYQITYNHLTERTQFFAYHMKYHHYFSYLQLIFNFRGFIKKNHIKQWKEKLRKSIQQKIPEGRQEINRADIDQAIFYLQLRSKSSFLYSKSIQVNDFPCIHSQIISRIIRDPLLKGNQSSLRMVLMCIRRLILDFQETINTYRKMNIIQKAIFFYHLNYFRVFKSKNIPQLKQYTFGSTNPLIEEFFQKLSNSQLLELIQFFLFQIELGNYYRIQQLGPYSHQNQVNKSLYDKIISILYFRIMQSLNTYKAINKTIDIKFLSVFSKYFILLIKTLYIEDNDIFICRNCKKIQELYSCDYCEQIMLGVKLNNRKSVQFTQSDFFPTKMIDDLTLKATLIFKQISILRKEHNGEWLIMFSLVLQEIMYFTTP